MATISSSIGAEGVAFVSMSAVTVRNTAYIFYFNPESNKLHICLDDGSSDSVVKVSDKPIIATHGNNRLAAIPHNLNVTVYYVDDGSFLCELTGEPKSGGGFSWKAWRLKTKTGGKELQVINKSPITATTGDGSLRVFYIAPGGAKIQARWTSATGWYTTEVSRD